MNGQETHPCIVWLFLKDVEGASQRYNSNQSSSDNADKSEYIWWKLSFLAEAERHKGEYTVKTAGIIACFELEQQVRNVPSKCRKMLVHHQMLLSTRCWSAWDYSSVEIEPCYFFDQFDQISSLRRLGATEKNTYFRVSSPLFPESARTVKSSSHICFPHFPRSSEWRVS